MSISEAYDAIIIGSGVGGLVCAADLAKAGIKVLVVEKHHVSGGYCSSFTKGGYYFDACAHYLGSCRPEGQLGQLLKDHSVDSRLKLIKTDPTDIIVTQNSRVKIRREIADTLEELKQIAPKEVNALKGFLKYVTEKPTIELYVELKKLTFRALLDQYFQSEELKAVLAMPLGNIGLPSTMASAVTCVLLYREFVLDGGYYPVGGMQAFPDIMVKRIKEYGGDVSFLTPAQQIVVNQQSDSVQGCVLKIGRGKPIKISAKSVIANCDQAQVFLSLLPETYKSYWKTSGFDKCTPSASAFMMHIGLNMNLDSTYRDGGNVWYYTRGNVDHYYERLVNGEVEYGDGFVFCSVPSVHDRTLNKSPSKHSVQLIVGVPSKTKQYWEENMERFASDVISKRFERIIPGASKNIEVSNVATPYTLIKYTGNYMGAMYGWASTPEQTGRKDFGLGDCPVSGLFLTGHWSGLPVGFSGIPLVVSSGRNVAKRVLRYLRTKARIVASN